jgi:hypothetical protein
MTFVGFAGLEVFRCGLRDRRQLATPFERRTLLGVAVQDLLRHSGHAVARAVCRLPPVLSLPHPSSFGAGSSRSISGGPCMAADLAAAPGGSATPTALAP